MTRVKQERLKLGLSMFELAAQTHIMAYFGPGRMGTKAAQQGSQRKLGV